MADKKNSDARIRANNRYNDKTYDRINIAIPKGQKDVICDYAEARGDTINGLLNHLITEEMEGRASTPPHLLPRDTLQAAETAAAAAGEDTITFLKRAIATQAALDLERLRESRCESR